MVYIYYWWNNADKVRSTTQSIGVGHIGIVRDENAIPSNRHYLTKSGWQKGYGKMRDITPFNHLREALAALYKAEGKKIENVLNYDTRKRKPDSYKLI
jgi:hypothetical protein